MQKAFAHKAHSNNVCVGGGGGRGGQHQTATTLQHSRSRSSALSFARTRWAARPSAARRLPDRSPWLRSLNARRTNAASCASRILQSQGWLAAQQQHASVGRPLAFKITLANSTLFELKLWGGMKRECGGKVQMRQVSSCWHMHACTVDACQHMRQRAATRVGALHCATRINSIQFNSI